MSWANWFLSRDYGPQLWRERKAKTTQITHEMLARTSEDYGNDDERDSKQASFHICPLEYLIRKLIECGMLEMKGIPCFRCFPDKVALIDSAALGTWWWNEKHAILVRIKTSIASSNLGSTSSIKSADVKNWSVDDSALGDLLPKKHSR